MAASIAGVQLSDSPDDDKWILHSSLYGPKSAYYDYFWFYTDRLDGLNICKR